MSQNVYYIIAGGAGLFVIYFIFLQKMMKKRKQQQLEALKKDYSGEPLTDAQKRLLSFGAFLFYYRGEKILEMMPDQRLDIYVYGLKQQWEVSNAEEAKETLTNLLQLRRSAGFESLLQQASPELSKIQKRIARGLEIELSDVEQVQSAYAWDICRAVSLAKWCYWSGYLTESETWSVMEQAALIATHYGSSWSDYTISFLLGRTIQGFDPDEIIVQCRQLMKSQHPSLRKIENLDVFERYAFK